MLFCVKDRSFAYWNYVSCSSCVLVLRMSRSSDVSAIIPSTVSVGVGTDPTLEIVEKVDWAV